MVGTIDKSVTILAYSHAFVGMYLVQEKQHSANIGKREQALNCEKFQVRHLPRTSRQVRLGLQKYHDKNEVL